MYIGLAITSDSYSDLYYEVGSDLERLKKKMEEQIAFPNNEVIWYSTKNKCYGVSPVIRGTAPCTEDDWGVIEIYEIDNAPWVMVKWHAFDGVDFAVQTYRTQEEARRAMRYEADNTFTQFGSPIADWQSDYVEFDTGDEWRMFKVIQLSEENHTSKPGKILAIVGMSGSGKDTIAKHISNRYGTPMLVSYTTRKIREYETNGKEHWFISKEKMEWLKQKEKLIAYTYNAMTGVEYCATKSQISSGDVIYIINPDGIRWLKEQAPDVELISIYVDVPLPELKKRLQARGDNTKTYETRLASEQEEFLGYRDNADGPDLIVQNDDLDTALETVDGFIDRVVLLDANKPVYVNFDKGEETPFTKEGSKLVSACSFLVEAHDLAGHPDGDIVQIFPKVPFVLYSVLNGTKYKNVVEMNDEAFVDGNKLSTVPKFAVPAAIERRIQL